MTQCITCQKSFSVRDEDREFYKTFDVPDPTLCPECRLQKRLQFRNERTLYYRTSSLSNEKIISIYGPESPYKVYSPQEWWSDKWDGLEFGRDFDFNRPFFEQFQELLLEVPRIALFNVNPDNSDYCQQAYDNRNCYLCSVVTKCEDCMYLTHSNNMSDCYDCSFTQKSELSYDCLDSESLYGCVSSQSCQNSSGLWFCYDLIGCQDCFGCFGLRNKKHYIFNKAFSQEEYQQKMESLQLQKYSNYTKLKEHFSNVSKNAIHRADQNLNTIDSEGNYLINSKNCYQCYDSYQIEECAYSTWIFESHHIYDVYGLGGGEWILEGLGVEKLNMGAFNTFVSDSGEVYYSDSCFHSMSLFGCAGLRNKKFCIFNKQYSEEEFKNFRSKIVEHMKSTGEWGQFFPESLSPFAYNETVAQTLYPLTKEEAMTQSYRWRDPDQKDYHPQTYQIPDDLKDVQADITQQTLACESCAKNYRVSQQELNFYKSQKLPVPRKCPDCRYMERRSLRNPRILYDRNCDKCSNGIRTSYSSNRTEKVYCQQCYLEEVD